VQKVLKRLRDQVAELQGDLEDAEQERDAARRERDEARAVAANPAGDLDQPIKQHFADGKWHPLGVMADRLATDEAHVRVALGAMQQDFAVKVEHKQVGTHVEYRLFKSDQAVSTTELTEKLTPLIAELKVEGKKNMATMVPPRVAELAFLLQQLLNAWTD
jgi:hypothetical protein